MEHPPDDISYHEPISIEQYNKELDEAEVEFERGEYISSDEMQKLIREWLKKAGSSSGRPG